MSSATASRSTRQKPTEIGVCGLAAAAVIYAGCLVCYDADGYLVDGADTAGLRFAGVAREDVDNADGSDGDLNGTFFRRNSFRFASTGLTQADVGKRAYLIDNQTVGIITHASVDQAIYVGVITEVESATACYVDLDLCEAPSGAGANVETLAADKTLVPSDAELQKLDPGGANRDVTLPAEDASTNRRFRVVNAADAAENLVVKSDAPATIATLNQNEAAWFYCDGTTWSHGGIETIALT